MDDKTIKMEAWELEHDDPPPRPSRDTVLAEVPVELSRLSDGHIHLLIAIAHKLENDPSGQFEERLAALLEAPARRRPRDTAHGLAARHIDHDVQRSPPSLSSSSSRSDPEIASPKSAPADPISGSGDEGAKPSEPPVPQVDPKPAQPAASAQAAGWVRPGKKVPKRPRKRPDRERKVAAARVSRRQAKSKGKSAADPSVTGNRAAQGPSGAYQSRDVDARAAERKRVANALRDFVGEKVRVPAVPAELATAARRAGTYGLELFYMPPDSVELPDLAHSYTGTKEGSLYQRGAGGWMLMDMTRPPSQFLELYHDDKLISQTEVKRTTRFGMSFLATEEALRQIRENLRLGRLKYRLLSPGEWLFFANFTRIPFMDDETTVREWVSYWSQDRGRAVGGLLMGKAIAHTLYKRTEAVRDVGFRFCIAP